jgi:LmbE family N-acetylglucosaminyl deacetylase
MMKQVRIKEQKRAADLGKYQDIVFLNFPSEKVKASDASVRMAMKRVITRLQPEFIYTHNLCDKHPTHVAVAHQLIQTINALPADAKPKALYGVEVWRDLDWMSDDEKVVFDVSKGKRMTQKQLLAHQSQVAGGKRYDLATIGRRSAHATYRASHTVDQASQLIYAMDLTPLIDGREKSIHAFVQAKIDRFVKDVMNQINE